MLLRFYYFCFLYFYKDKPESWDGWFRALLLVELTIFGICMLLGLLINKSVLHLTPYTRVVSIALNIVILIILYYVLAAKGRHENIYDEFINHHWNTKRTRIICWGIWISSLLLPMAIAVYYKGYISWQSS
ncbi:hypothetical protein CPT03_12835 [Pedobacter ginsengisoli]|uniref:Uncharacterized protein n=1 Tax=Pedobacter ginsengisoli TaxID=363852 RepID=A0A2D1U6W7_9SPHI|nr:hypothetical protein CPT03_12835 [Pedobacter ginsengisoli]